MICCDFCEEWYHGDCIQITEKESKAIKKYYCDQCRKADPTLRTVVKGAPSQQPQQSTSSKDKEMLKKKKDKSETRCGNCDGCRSRAMGKKGKCEKRLSSYQLKKKEKKIKEGRLK
jgi:COMPASS component SPP1